MLVKEIVVATRNPKKAEELSRILQVEGLVVLSLKYFSDCPEVIEDGETFEENAIKKALSAARCTGKLSVADDSGLLVDALGGRPGVYSARYAGEGADDQSNNNKLLREMESIGDADRGARFVCVIALASKEGLVKTFEGVVEGRIAREPRGTMGFGYDPLFIPHGWDRTFGEIEANLKDSMSHRGNALRKFKNYLFG